VNANKLCFPFSARPVLMFLCVSSYAAPVPQSEDAPQHVSQDHPQPPSQDVSSSSTSSSAQVSQIDGFCTPCGKHHITWNAGNKRFSHSAICPKSKPDILPVMLVGDAGTGVGSRIKGHTRRGGKKLRKEHTKHCPVVMTDEYRSSRTCTYCFHELQTARYRRTKDGKDQMVRVHGARSVPILTALHFKSVIR